MPVHELDAVFYASVAPTFEFRDGMFLVGYSVGKCHFEFAMSPSVFLRARKAANKAIDEFHAGSETKVVAHRKREVASH